MREKLKSIDYLKCIACILIINSHIAPLYPGYLSRLSWGGFFGNNMFFFVSGYCLSKINKSFPMWYWRRFVRVYTPYLFFIPFLFFTGKFNGLNILNILMPFRSYHFIPTILVLYIIYYFVVYLDIKNVLKINMTIFIVAIISVAYFFGLYDYKTKDIYEHFTVLEMLSYLCTMLFAYKASRKKCHSSNKTHAGIAVLCFLVYMYQSIFHFPKVLGLIQLAIGIAFAFSFGCFMIGLEDKLKNVKIITIISTVTLEIYIVHYVCIDAYCHIGFPTNIIFFVISTISIAYCLHLLSNNVINFIISRTKNEIKNG